jgi:exopolyphosphatase / guanosine-5'-triphosphate,3'-diphosphate pyrophosphatase
MRCACVDIGSNTTRLLVAEPGTGPTVLADVAADRVFTCLGAGRAPDGTIPEDRVAAVAAVVAAQVDQARRAGAERVRAVATAAIRTAPNRAALCAAVAEAAGIEVEVLSGEQEAALAFAGALGTLAPDARPGPDERVGVVDVGGGSTELACGTVRDGVAWLRSFPVGSGGLTERWIGGDCPRDPELVALRAEVAAALHGHGAPRPVTAYAVGGSATSLGRLTGGRLEPLALALALTVLCSGPVDLVAPRLGLHPDRVRMLPAGIVILDEAARALGVPLRVAAASR